MIKLNMLQIKSLKQALNYELLLKKAHWVIKFNQNAWLKPYIDMNTDIRKKKKNIRKNQRKNRDIKLVTAERRRNYLVLKLNDHTTNFFTENLLAIEMKKNEDTYE